MSNANNAIGKRNLRSQAWFNHIDTTIIFATSGSITNLGAEEYIKQNDNQQEKIEDAVSANNLLRNLLFSQVIDNFQCYLSEIIYEILNNNPKTIFGKKFDAKIAFESPDIESLKRNIVDKYVLDLGYRNIEDLSDFMKNSFGIKALEKKITQRRLNRLVQIRNIITHNRGIVNDLYMFRSQSKRDSVGNHVWVPHPLQACDYLEALVRSIDTEAVAKFNLPPGMTKNA